MALSSPSTGVERGVSAASATTQMIEVDQEEDPMRTTTARCDRIVALIDERLADYERTTHSPRPTEATATARTPR